MMGQHLAGLQKFLSSFVLSKGCGQFIRARKRYSAYAAGRSRLKIPQQFKQPWNKRLSGINPGDSKSMDAEQLQPRPSCRHADWVDATHNFNTRLLEELIAEETPGQVLFELETFINGLYRSVQYVAWLNSSNPHGFFSSKEVTEAANSAKLKVSRVMPYVKKVRASLGWNIREFDLQLLRLMRKSSALSPVIGAGASMASPCRAPSWADLVQGLLETTLEKGLELKEPNAEDMQTIPSYLRHLLGQVPGMDFPGSGNALPAEGIPTACHPSGLQQDNVIQHTGDVKDSTFKDQTSVYDPQRTVFPRPEVHSDPPQTQSWTIRQNVTEVRRYNKDQECTVRRILESLQRCRENKESPNVDELTEGAQVCYDLCGQHLFTLLTSILYRNDRQPSEVHKAIAKLAHAQVVPDRGNTLHPGWDTIITYNFDAFIEIALSEEKVPHAAWAMRGDELMGDPDSLALRNGQGAVHQSVYHLHGYTPRKLFKITGVKFVFATSQYMRTYQTAPSAIFRKVVDEYLENPVHIALYIGCSFIDKEMNQLLSSAFETLPGRYHYAFLQWPRARKEGEVPTSEEIEESSRDYLKIGVRPVWYFDHAEIPGLIARLA